MFDTTYSDPSEAVRAFIQQYYDQERTIPEEILIGEPFPEQELLAEWLTELKGQGVRVRVAKRGDGRRLLAMAAHNAANYLLIERPRVTDPGPALQRLKERLRLEHFPHRLECVDISNIRGRFPVGSIVVFRDGEPDKSAYRRYRIQGVNRLDDTAMMAEVIQRRFSDQRDTEVLPDLLVVDGGKGQLNQSLAVLRKLDLADRVRVVSLAKQSRTSGRLGPGSGDRLYLPGRKIPLVVKDDPSLLFLLARLRDEAHRFAISYYQKRHRRELLQSSLDQIRGIGPKRRRDLLRRFGSVKRLAEASVEEIGQVPGISRKLAERILAALH
jgi:excinuclease ABC subunit C